MYTYCHELMQKTKHNIIIAALGRQILVILRPSNFHEFEWKKMAIYWS